MPLRRLRVPPRSARDSTFANRPAARSRPARFSPLRCPPERVPSRHLPAPCDFSISWLSIAHRLPLHGCDPFAGASAVHAEDSLFKTRVRLPRRLHFGGGLRSPAFGVTPEVPLPLDLRQPTVGAAVDRSPAFRDRSAGKPSATSWLPWTGRTRSYFRESSGRRREGAIPRSVRRRISRGSNRDRTPLQLVCMARTRASDARPAARHRTRLPRATAAEPRG